VVRTVPPPVVADVLNRYIPVLLCSQRQILCLQVEPFDDVGDQCASYVLNRSSDVITDGSVPVVKQVSHLIYE